MIKKSDVNFLIVSGKNPFSASSGGYATYAYSLSKTISSLGYKVKIFCCNHKTAVFKHKIGLVYLIKSKILSFPIMKSAEMAGLIILAPQLAQIVKNHLEADKVNIIWGVGPWTLAAVLLKLIFRNRKIVVIAHYATSLKHEFRGTLEALQIKDYGFVTKLKALIIYLTIIQIYSLIERFTLHFTDKIVIHYSSTKKILMAQYKIKENKFYHLPYFVNLIKKTENNTKKSLPKLLKKPLIILICRQDPRKGINFLLHALAILNNQNLSFQAILIGGGRMLSSNRELAKKLKLNNVFLPGFIADTNPFLKQADLYVFPSIEEGNSAFSILEAMKEGLPIVSTNVDGISEDLEDGKSALLAPPKDPKALADAIERLLKDQILAKKLANAAKKRYYQKYNLSRVKREIRSFLTSFQGVPLSGTTWES